AIWLVLIGFRVRQVNHPIAIAMWAIALLLFLSGLRRTESAGGTAPGAFPTTTPSQSPNIETISMPSAPPDARPIEPDMGGATGKLIVLAIVVLALGLLAAFLFRSQGWK